MNCGIKPLTTVSFSRQVTVWSVTVGDHRTYQWLSYIVAYLKEHLIHLGALFLNKTEPHLPRNADASYAQCCLPIVLTNEKLSILLTIQFI